MFSTASRPALSGSSSAACLSISRAWSRRASPRHTSASSGRGRASRRRSSGCSRSPLSSYSTPASSYPSAVPSTASSSHGSCLPSPPTLHSRAPPASHIWRALRPHSRRARPPTWPASPSVEQLPCSQRLCSRCTPPARLRLVLSLLTSLTRFARPSSRRRCRGCRTPSHSLGAHSAACGCACCCRSSVHCYAGLVTCSLASSPWPSTCRSSPYPSPSPSMCSCCGRRVSTRLGSKRRRRMAARCLAGSGRRWWGCAQSRCTAPSVPTPASPSC
mmetsp:Transcript_32307/g.76942  ORF Transcript_32307/g.76942 Transcript_32307/m.76942 type:complete len:274 (-) Transcript_32307:1082-1903(-)